MKFLLLKLKKIPEKFFIIKGMPGINLKIINKKRELLFILMLLNEVLIDCLKYLANRNDNVDAIVKDIIDRKDPKYPNISVDKINIGVTIPTRHIHKIEVKK